MKGLSKQRDLTHRKSAAAKNRNRRKERGVGVEVERRPRGAKKKGVHVDRVERVEEVGGKGEDWWPAYGLEARVTHQ